MGWGNDVGLTYAGGGTNVVKIFNNRGTKVGSVHRVENWYNRCPLTIRRGARVWLINPLPLNPKD